MTILLVIWCVVLVLFFLIMLIEPLALISPRRLIRYYRVLDAYRAVISGDQDCVPVEGALSIHRMSIGSDKGFYIWNETIGDVVMSSYKDGLAGRLRQELIEWMYDMTKAGNVSSGTLK